MNPLDQDDDQVPPLDPVKVALFAILLCGIAFASWRFLRAQAAVAAEAEAEAPKDYRKLFQARSGGVPEAPPQSLISVADSSPASGMMLKIDDDMRAPKPVEVAPVEQKAPVVKVEAEAPAPPPVVLPAAPAPVAPSAKTFVQPKLNSSGLARLNGGAGIRPKSDAKK